MESDRELLELAAKAADIHRDAMDCEWYDSMGTVRPDWNPLTDDGDALRLAVALSQMDGGLALMLNSRLNSAGFAQCYTNESVVAPTEYMDDPRSATRRAIVLAAAEIGKTL